MTDTKIRLQEIKAPGIEVELQSGRTIVLDPFEVARRLESTINPNAGLQEQIRTIREAMGIGVDDARDFHVLYLHRKLMDLVGEQIRSKDAPPAPQS